jgi:hypothetical protein
MRIKGCPDFGRLRTWRVTFKFRAGRTWWLSGSFPLSIYPDSSGRLRSFRSVYGELESWSAASLPRRTLLSIPWM